MAHYEQANAIRKVKGLAHQAERWVTSWCRYSPKPRGGWARAPRPARDRGRRRTTASRGGRPVRRGPNGDQGRPLFSDLLEASSLGGQSASVIDATRMPNWPPIRHTSSFACRADGRRLPVG